MVTNGALGLLPLSLLPTARVEVHQQGPAFAGYVKVPWLARTHAVTMVPSAAALRTLRTLPPGPATRGKLIAFGDPYFSETQANEAENDKPVTIASADGVAMRGLPLKRRSSPQTQGADSAELALLPRLPDTADELRSIALALEADPAKTLYLGKAANESAVRKLDLSGSKVVVFATHGLVPGDLNGLTQPALALTAPKVAAVQGDGLLTMEEILTRRATLAPGPARVPKPHLAWAALSSMPARAPFSSPIGRCIRSRRANWCPTCSGGRLQIPSSRARSRCSRR